MTISLCERCEHCRVVTSGKGSRFLLCQLATADARWAKYPPQPVVRCAGFLLRVQRSADEDRR